MLVYLATGAVGVKLTLTGLEQHTFRHDGGTDSLVTARHRAAHQEDAEKEAGDEHQAMRFHVVSLRRCKH